MANDPPQMNLLNGALRFLLELAGLLSVGLWGLQRGNLLWGAAAIAVFILIWTLFNVPGDPSRSGKAPIPIPGLLRLFIELILFTWAMWSLGSLGLISYSRYFGILLIIHYLAYWRRIVWLVEKKPSGEMQA